MNLMHLAYRIAQQVRLVYWLIAKPRVFGVKVVALRDDDHVLLVRHSYQSRELFMLPGGGMKAGADVFDTAIREVREETGCALGGLRIHGEFLTSAEGARNHVTVVVGRVEGDPQIDGGEIAEARFVSLHDLPQTVAPATLRRLIEVRDGLPPGDSW